MTKGTALVTGASAGLGVLFAEALAADGHALILTARRGDRLGALAERLRAAHGVAVDTIALDLAAPGSADALMAEIAARGLAVNLLVNNAGFGLGGAFAAQDRSQLARMIALNCRSLTELCHAVLPGMIQMRRGAILNVASTAAFQPGPGMAVYYATKAFVLSLSEALHEEVRRDGVRVTALCPGPTATEFFNAAGVGGSSALSKLAGDPAKVVRDGLAALAANRAVKVSGAANAAMAFATRLTPRIVLRRVVAATQRAR
ncbi:SDR family NAD(P)-dependent oxidoreductase [Sphingomonas hengshuiensis]|uniref:Short-chain dehydrogenase n=1 Tax=Sphingomonas hengshuiensis TaxID=1609977 RepID=A0A7U4JAL0_9SPHN|nr:SDR family oxidoreductase [Sphingomonas hengshuiensis]AJP73307.1 short-chain dehydrogenase [Sphingomonas hengshuiensis]